MVQAFVKILMRTTLYRTLRILQEGHVFGFSQIRQVNQDRYLAAKGRLKHSVQKTIQIEFREFTAISGCLNGGHGGSHHRGVIGYSGSRFYGTSEEGGRAFLFEKLGIQLALCLANLLNLDPKGL